MLRNLCIYAAPLRKYIIRTVILNDKTAITAQSNSAYYAETETDTTRN